MDYQNDPRTPCKYGATCYQKNPLHQKKFKHPTVDVKETNGDKDIQEPQTSLSPSPTPHTTSPSSPPHKKKKIDTSFSSSEAESEQDDSQVKSTSHNSDSEEEDFLPSSPSDVRKNIKQKFLVEMPEDFFEFWDLCRSLNKECPEDAFSCVGMKLVGPYDILNGKLSKLDKKKRVQSSYLQHWRFYHDPPEFQTVLIGLGHKDDFHIGYFRDNPHEMPLFVASTTSENPRAGSISILGPNIFAAVGSYVSNKLEKADPFSKTGLQKCLKSLQTYAHTNNISLERKTSEMKAREKLVVAKSFHGAGIVVPVDKKTDVGYREIPETNSDLKKILKKIVDAPDENSREQRFEVLQEILTNVQWGTDEGDFGMGLELGIDLLTYGGEVFHSSIHHLLTVAYELLGRQPYAEIIKAHLKNRRKGAKLSILD